VEDERMTQGVINSVRKALGRSVNSPLVPYAGEYVPRNAGRVELELDLFLKEISVLSGLGQRVTAAGVANAMQSLVNEERVRKAVVWPTSRLSALGIVEVLRDAGIELVSPFADKHAMAECDLGVTEADFVLPETGTLGLYASPDRPRAVSLLPRVHLAIVSPTSLRADLHHVLGEAKSAPNLVLITGPSRTADIELTITLGVHGPRSLYVWIVQE
jgi:L-lactate dehydrogenase complex protein LldG